jgi:hypothetical protein
MSFKIIMETNEMYERRTIFKIKTSTVLSMNRFALCLTNLEAQSNRCNVTLLPLTNPPVFRANR